MVEHRADFVLLARADVVAFKVLERTSEYDLTTQRCAKDVLIVLREAAICTGDKNFPAHAYSSGARNGIHVPADVVGARVRQLLELGRKVARTKPIDQPGRVGLGDQPLSRKFVDRMPIQAIESVRHAVERIR